MAVETAQTTSKYPHTHEEDNPLGLRCTLHQKLPTLVHAIISVPASLVSALYKEASLAQKNVAEAQGFSKGKVPLDYIQENFKTNLIEHLEEFLFNYAVIDFLFQEIRRKKLLVAGEPRLIGLDIDPYTDAHFHFQLSLFPAPPIQEWKYLPFRAPKRKNYKDLDRQVATFIQEEKERLAQVEKECITIGDWVYFAASLTTPDGLAVLGPHKARFWVKIGKEEADSSFRELLCEKKVGDTFGTTCQALQEYFSECIDTTYTFAIEIIDVITNTFFCLESFKKQFKIKTNKALYQKLVEVFSYRNDLSQRRAMAQEAVALLLSKYQFNVPNYLILRQQKKLIEAIKYKPDYHVYRTQKDFKAMINRLAEKQAREMIFLDHLAYHEKITVTDPDVKQYLNLSNRPRTKEFIYFDMPLTKQLGQEVPLPAQELKQYCLREKTINHIIYHLTKK